jgi:hypothetical protein
MSGHGDHAEIARATTAVAMGLRASGAEVVEVCTNDGEITFRAAPGMPEMLLCVRELYPSGRAFVEGRDGTRMMGRFTRPDGTTVTFSGGNGGGGSGGASYGGGAGGGAYSGGNFVPMPIMSNGDTLEVTTDLETGKRTVRVIRAGGESLEVVSPPDYTDPYATPADKYVGSTIRDSAILEAEWERRMAESVKLTDEEVARLKRELVLTPVEMAGEPR